MKKGTKSWRPAQVMNVKPIPGYRVGWASTEPSRMTKKKAEGWVNAKDLIKEVKINIEDDSLVSDINGAFEYRDLALMALPEELAQARAEYYEEQNLFQSQTPATRAKGAVQSHKDLIFDVNDPAFKEA